MAREPFSGHLDLILLAALDSGPRHGYAVIEHIRRSSGGHFDYPEKRPSTRRCTGWRPRVLLRSAWNDEGGRRRRV